MIISVGAGGAVDIYTQRGTELIVDMSGYITDASTTPGTGGLFVPINPTRMLDTRPAYLLGYHASSTPGAGAIVTVDTWFYTDTQSGGHLLADIAGYYTA